MQKKFQKRGKTVKIGVFYFQQEKIWSIFANKGTTLPPATKTAILSYFDTVLHFIALWHNDCRITSN